MPATSSGPPRGPSWPGSPATGELRVLVAATYPLDDAADAHRQIATGHTTGKIALLP